MSAERSAGEPVLVLVSPAALSLDGESVRVAKDVLGAALTMKTVVPESLSDLDRLLARRGRRRPVVIGDDRYLQQVVQLLHQQATLDAGPLGVIPVGRGHRTELARALGAEVRPVQAARAVVSGADRALDLLVDDDGGVVLGAVRIPGQRSPRANRTPSTWWTGLTGRVFGERSFGEHGLGDRSSGDRSSGDRSSADRGMAGVVGKVARVIGPRPPAEPSPLRVEADGQVLADPAHPMRALALSSHGGSAELRIDAAVPIQAHRVTVGGTLFTYEADHTLSAPVSERTWTVEPAAWSLCVPRQG